VEREHGEHRPEDFLLGDAHRSLYLIEQRRPHEESPPQLPIFGPRPAGDHPGAFTAERCSASAASRHPGLQLLSVNVGKSSAGSSAVWAEGKCKESSLSCCSRLPLPHVLQYVRSLARIGRFVAASMGAAADAAIRMRTLQPCNLEMRAFLALHPCCSASSLSR
jgi:hypothetical protein